MNTPAETGKPQPPPDAQMEARVTALEAQVATLEAATVALDDRVTALEGDDEEGIVPEPPDPPLPTGGLTVTLDLPSGALTFSEAEATDRGDYVGPFVHQHCLAQRKGAWTVFFRPDADGSRNEVVIEYGGFDLSTLPPTPAVTPSHILEPFTATITAEDGTTLATVTAPQHFWLTRWRWQSSERPIRRDLRVLVAMKAVLPLSLTAAWNTTPPATGIAWGGPMSSAGLTLGMGGTGDRAEIGFLTEPQASYLLNGDANSLQTLLAQAEAAGSFPIWVRDSTTEALLDVQAKPYMAFNDAYGGTHLIASAGAAPGMFEMDVAHLPAVSYVAWLLTDDPFYLEGAQACANYGIISSNYHAINQELPGLTSTSQTRNWAWGMRDLFRMAGFTPAAPPSWLLPKSYWQAVVADNLTFANKYLAATAPAVSVFHLITNSGYVSSFMQDYLQIVTGWVRWSRLFPEWDQATEWIAGPRLAMSGVIPGWDRRWPAPYQVPILNAREGAGAPLVDAGYDAPNSPLTPTSWQELWDCYLTWAGLDNSSWQPDILAPGQNLGYVAEARGALAAIALTGDADTQAAHDWLHQQLDVAEVGGNPSGFKWAVIAPAISATARR